MTLTEALEVTRQRRDWLTERIKAKQSIGWDVEWDRREALAHSILLAQLERPATLNTGE